ncbi:hypothetical protein ACSQ67_021700 [Phaseolus vulgaris]
MRAVSKKKGSTHSRTITEANSHFRSAKDFLPNSHILSSPHVLSSTVKRCFADSIPICAKRWTEIAEAASFDPVDEPDRCCCARSIAHVR